MKINKVLVVESQKQTTAHMNGSRRLRQFLGDLQMDFDWVYHNNLVKDQLNEVDLVITFGGDGTFIEAANLIEDSFILGINSHPNSSEGALMSLSTDNLEDLKDILNGNFQILERQRAEVRLNGKLLGEYATNEVYVGALSQFYSSRYIINFKGKEEEQRSSGVIISTGTGSRAWHLSAGGKKFHHAEKKLSFVVREPYYGKRLYCPTIISGEILEDEKIVLTSKRSFGSILAIGFKAYDLKENDVVEVTLSENPLKVLVK